MTRLSSIPAQNPPKNARNAPKHTTPRFFPRTGGGGIAYAARAPGFFRFGRLPFPLCAEMRAIHPPHTPQGVSYNDGYR